MTIRPGPRPDALTARFQATVFLDGDRLTPGTDSCRCDPYCEFPCWQRIGIGDACEGCGCPPFPPDPDADADIRWRDLAFADTVEDIYPEGST